MTDNNINPMKKRHVVLKFLPKVSFDIPQDSSELKFFVMYKVLQAEQYKYATGDLKRQQVKPLIDNFRAEHENKPYWKKYVKEADEKLQKEIRLRINNNEDFTDII